MSTDTNTPFTARANILKQSGDLGRNGKPLKEEGAVKQGGILLLDVRRRTSQPKPLRALYMLKKKVQGVVKGARLTAADQHAWREYPQARSKDGLYGLCNASI